MWLLTHMTPLPLTHPGYMVNLSEDPAYLAILHRTQSILRRKIVWHRNVACCHHHMTVIMFFQPQGRHVFASCPHLFLQYRPGRALVQTTDPWYDPYGYIDVPSKIPKRSEEITCLPIRGSQQVKDKRDHCNGCTATSRHYGYSTYTTANLLGKELHTAPKHSIS